MAGHGNRLGEWMWVGVGLTAVIGAVVTALSILQGLGANVLLFLSLLILVRFAWKLMRGKFTVDFLMSVVGIITWYLGAYLEGFVILALYALSELAEIHAERFAEREITSLQKLIPSKALVKSESGLTLKPSESIRPGDVLLVRKGEAVVADGVVIKGETAFDTSAMTGEAEPVRAGPGTPVLSGYINLGNPVEVRVLKPFTESSFQILVREAERALGRKTRLERLLERVSLPYTLGLLGIYLVTSLIVGPYRGLAVLLAGCPSALIVTSGATTALTIGKLAKSGIVVRGGVVLEAATKVRTVIIDKTGTLTTGELRVTKVIPLSRYDEETILSLAGAAGKGSLHPVSRALAKHSGLIPEEVEETVGEGVKARVNGTEVIVGSEGFISKVLGHELEMPSSMCGEGSKPAYVAVEGDLAGVVCLEEEMSAEVRNVVQELKEGGLDIVLASGDEVGRVSVIAKELGVSKFFANLSPEEKVGLVRKIRLSDGPVAMVGDGINDAAALAEADLGIAIGPLSAVADVADAVIPDGVSKLPTIFSGARKYRAALMAGFALAATIKAIAIAAGLAGALPLWTVVGLGDDGSTILSVIVGYIIVSSKH